MLSFIVPAHNEEQLLGRTLESINSSAAAAGLPYELIVVDDHSTDRTAEIARAHGAIVEQVQLRKISAVRNAGARRAAGQFLFFVDADTILPKPSLTAALAVLRNGGIGGGALVSFDEPAAPWATVMLESWNAISRLGRVAAGCFVFVRRPVFEAVGGFDEAFFAGEEVILSQRIKAHGHFVIVGQRVITSMRKTKTHTLAETCGVMASLVFKGQSAWQSRDGLDFWYIRR